MKWHRWLALVIGVIMCLCALASCVRDDVTGGVETDLDYTDISLSEYIGEVTYKGMTVNVGDGTKEEALWSAILKNAQIKAYPEDKVRYYFEQEKASYMYLVGGDKDDYKALLVLRGITEEDMMARAKEMVAKDLIYRLVVEKEKIELTEKEKTELFDRYVDKYVADYGYGKAYVTANMSSIIYESMLYDKTMEYLILQNQFVE